MEDEIEDALNLLVSTAEQSNNMRKTLKEKIYETVSNLRQLFAKLKISGDGKQSEIKELTKKVSKLEDEILNCREKLSKAQQMPSTANTAEQNDQRPGLLETTSGGLAPKLTGEGEQEVALPSCNRNRQYASVFRESKPKRYKMTVKARSVLPTEEIKQLLKTKINPGEIKVGVISMKLLQGGVLIDTNTIEEMEVLGKEIQTKCGRELETHTQIKKTPA